MKGVIALSVSLVAALTAAYLTWTDDTEEPTDDSVPIYSTSEDALKKVTYASETLKVTIEQRKDDKGTYLWVDSTETKLPKKKKDPNDPHAALDAEGEEAEDHAHDGPEAPEPEPAADGPEEPPKIEHATFLASKQGDDLWKALAPLDAMRELEAPKDRATFGLDQPKGTLLVEHGAGTVELKLGGETYGSKDRYVEANGRIYLVDDAALKPLEFAATRILERNLFPLEEHQIDAVSVTSGSGVTLSWTHTNKDDPAKAGWSRPDSPDTNDAAGATWIDKMLRLKLRDYVEDPASIGRPTPVATYTVTGEGQTWKVEILRADDPAGAAQWYAKSDFNRATVSLTESLVKDLVTDLEDLASEQQP